MKGTAWAVFCPELFIRLFAALENRGVAFILDNTNLGDVVDWVDLLAGLYDGLGVGPSKEMADGLVRHWGQTTLNAWKLGINAKNSLVILA